VLLYPTIEGLFISAYGTTPGKFIFGIRVFQPNGNLASAGTAVYRSYLVQLLGNALYIPIAGTVANIVLFVQLCRGKPAVWDKKCNLIVVHKPLGAEFIGGVVLLGLGVWGLYISYPTLKQSADNLSSPVAVAPLLIVPSTIPVAPPNVTTITSNPFGDLSLIDPDTIPNIPPPPPGVTWQKDKDATNLYQTGLNYEKGVGVSQNYTTAMDFYQRAATKYDTTAMIGIARLYRIVPTEPNIPVALKWYQKAVSLGDPQAMTEIGVLYQNGIGVTQDFNQAMKWYKPAADAGNADAMYSIGFCYEGGWGVDKDIPTAINWYNKAVRQGSGDAGKALERLGHNPFDAFDTSTAPDTNRP
jgi:hypothetical protein